MAATAKPAIWLAACALYDAVEPELVAGCRGSFL